MRVHDIAFANFICKFGEQNLLDFVVEIVIPAFRETGVIRRYADTDYRFINVSLLNIGSDEEPNFAITGRFVKNTVLRRSQVLISEHEIAHDEAAIQSAPSSFFVLLLGNHRLIYFAETANAPDTISFARAAAAAIRDKHKVFIRNRKIELRSSNQTATLTSLMAQFPAPEVTVVPLTSEMSIDAFVTKYSKLQSVVFRLIRPNSEIQGSDLWRSVRTAGAAARSQQTAVSYKNPDGLNKSQTASQIKQAAETGQQIVTLSGKDRSGNSLKGNNEEFRLSVPLRDVPPRPRALAKRLVRVFQDLVGRGEIRLPRPEHDPRAAMERISRENLQ